jgi:hypothetical protein
MGRGRQLTASHLSVTTLTPGGDFTTEFDEESDFNMDESDVTGERGRPLTNAEKQQRRQQQQQQQQQLQQQQQQQQQKQQQQQQKQQQQQQKQQQQLQQQQRVREKQQQPLPQPQQQRYRHPSNSDPTMRRKQLYFGDGLTPPGLLNLAQNFQVSML